MRMTWRPLRLASLFSASLILTSSALLADPGAPLHVDAAVKNGVVRLHASSNGPFQYTTSRPTANLYVLDLNGVSTTEPAEARLLESDLVSSYRIVEAQAAGRTVVRLEILLRAPVDPQLERDNDRELTLVIARPGTTATEEAQAPALKIVVTNPASAQTLPVIDKIQLEQVGPRTEVRVAGNGRLMYHVQRLSQPERLVLDFVGTRLETPPRPVPAGLAPVRDVRAAQFTVDTARVVIDLQKVAPYHIEAAGSVVTVSFAPDDTPAPTKRPERNSITPRSTITTIKADSEHHASLKRQSPPESIPAQRTILPVALPANLTEPTAALASPAPAKFQQSPPGGNNDNSSAKQDKQAATPPPAADQNPPAQPAPAQTQPASQPPAQENPPAQPVSTPPRSARYSGEPISVNLKDVDLKDFFRLIHEISGLNVVVDPNVKGTLTIVLDEVPWDQALDIVLKNNDLDKQLDGNVLRIATKETLKKEAEQNRDLAKAETESFPEVTTTRVLSYAKASTLKDTLKKFLSPRGDILSDDRSNTLIIRDIESVIPVIDNLIRQLDRRSQQVEIEARVVAANRSFSREIGTQFAFATSAVNGKNIFGGATSVGTSPIIRNSPPLPIPPLVVGGSSGTGGTVQSQLPLVTNMPTTSPTSGVSYLFSSPNFALDYIITAAEAKGVGKLLSKPKVITQNNEKAVVKQGTKIPIQTVINNTISVQFVDAVLKLEVTPQITAEGTVFMDVTVENTQIDPAIPRVLGIPALDTQAAETKVLINDGGTVVIGGIIVSSQRTDIQQVPLFGSIPLLGNLFRHTTVSTSSQELLFFLTPRILPS